MQQRRGRPDALELRFVAAPYSRTRHAVGMSARQSRLTLFARRLGAAAAAPVRRSYFVPMRYELDFTVSRRRCRPPACSPACPSLFLALSPTWPPAAPIPSAQPSEPCSCTFVLCANGHNIIDAHGAADGERANAQLRLDASSMRAHVALPVRHTDRLPMSTR